MFETSSRRAVPPDGRGVLLAALVVLALAVAMSLYGPIDSIGHRLRFALLGPGSFALGAGLAWLIRRRRAR